MTKPTRYQRPPFEDALAAWKELLKENDFSTDILWILDENLCFEKDPIAARNALISIKNTADRLLKEAEAKEKK